MKGFSIRNLNSRCTRRYSSHTISKEKYESSLKYCYDLVRDYEGFLCGQFVHENLRPQFFSIRAFNLEVSSILDATSKQQIALMRFQFWKDTIDSLYKGKPIQQPVALQLFDTIQKNKLSSGFFKKNISARVNYFQKGYFSDLDELETYSEDSCSSLLYLKLEMLGIRDVEIDHLFSHLGKAIGITNNLRALPHHLSNRASVLPTQLLAKHKISEEELFQHFSGDALTPEQHTKLSDLTFELSTLAHDHLLTARYKYDELLSSKNKDLIRCYPVLISILPTSRYLKSLESVNFDPLHLKLKRKDWALPFSLWQHFQFQKKF